jgi:putative PIN family toxin of toxin-antitoxin system
VGEEKKVVIDTNIFISGFGWDAKPEEVLKLLKQRRIVNYVSIKILDELKRVVSYPKLKFSDLLQNKIIEFVFFYSEIIEPTEHISHITKDPDDNKFLECAIAANAEFIISGDPHLIKVAEYRAVKIVDAATFLNIVLNRQ